MEPHHAYLVHASSLELALLPTEYKTPSADVSHHSSVRFTIDDARELSRNAQQQAFGGGHRVFIIVAEEIAVEAQHALLKLLEEPPEATLFYILLKPTSFLLPTLRSRLHESTQERSTEVESNEEFNTFMLRTYAERLTLIAEKTKEKDTVWIEGILSGCEAVAAQNPLQNKELLKALLFVRTYIGNRGSSAKMLLEELSLLIPLK